MTQFLPPNLLALFAPRDPLPFKVPVDKLLTEKKRAPISGVAEYIHLFEDPKDTPPKPKIETKEERRERKRREKAELQAYKIEQGIAMWAPAENTSATSDPYKTMFIGRINFETTESKLRREFETYGPIRKIVLVQKKNDGKPRGYAFIEFEKERDMHERH
uniref:U1 small nuclear ribonucleoprotein 70 kDa n=1 Tax=Plectus sambesii TaxID=2011161 RepID=A0A914WUT9_9BILA